MTTIQNSTIGSILSQDNKLALKVLERSFELLTKAVVSLSSPAKKIDINGDVVGIMVNEKAD